MKRNGPDVRLQVPVKAKLVKVRVCDTNIREIEITQKLPLDDLRLLVVRQCALRCGRTIALCDEGAWSLDPPLF